jgi:hypothetical protein
MRAIQRLDNFLCRHGHHRRRGTHYGGGPLAVGGLKPHQMRWQVCLNCGTAYLMNPVFAGTGVVVSMAFANTTGAATDPSTIALMIKPGSSAKVTWTYLGGQLQKASVGNYTAALDTTPGIIGTPGLWTLEGIGTGACGAVAVTAFTVNALPL